MRWLYYDPQFQAHVLRAEELLEEARVYVARRALLRDSRAPRRPARVWLGSVLVAVGHCLLRSAHARRARVPS